MTAYFTSGTYDFLTKMASDHPEEQILLMNGENSTVAYYEDENNEVFDEARKYDEVVSEGKLQSEGFVVMNNIPVTEEGKPIFEDQFKRRAGMMEKTPGFQALRVLRPHRGNTYIVMVQWENEQRYNDWRNSDSFAGSHSKKDKKDTPSYSAGPSYVTKYYMAKEDA